MLKKIKADRKGKVAINRQIAVIDEKLQVGPGFYFFENQPPQRQAG